MNKSELLQVFQNLYDRNKKLSKREHNKLVYYLKTIDRIERENSLLIDRMLNKAKHVISVKTKVRCNNDYNEQIEAIKKQCGYTYDVFNFCTLLNSGNGKQVKAQKTKNKKASKSKVKTIKKAELPAVTLNEAIKKQKTLAIMRQAVN